MIKYLTTFFVGMLIYVAMVSIVRADLMWLISHDGGGLFLRLVGIVVGGVVAFGRYIND